MTRVFALVGALGIFYACGPSSDVSTLASASRRDPIVANSFPEHPDLSMTPGALCRQPDEVRYPEHIPYCIRNVSPETKQAIIRDYDRAHGYHVESMERTDFKIDHFIPLCMGGANSTANLWPQYKTIYVHTDPIEQKLCELMANGTMLQAAAVAKIKYIKFHLNEAEAMVADLDRQLSRN